MLPSYDKVSADLQMHDVPHLPLPETTPTKKGLARYLATRIKQSGHVPLDTPDMSSSIPEWQAIWFACSTAYWLLMEYHSIKTPSDTFKQEKARVMFLLRDPGLRRGNTTARRAYRWATS